MADKKISQLTGATTPLAGTEVLPIVQSGSTVKVAVSDLTAGRAPSMTGATVTGLTASKPVFTDGSKALTSSGTLGTDQGGTGLTGFTANSVVYSSSTSALSASGNLRYNGTNLGVGSADYGNAGTINVAVGVPGTTAGGLQLWSGTSSTHFIQFGDGTAGDGPYRGYISYAHGTDTLELGAAAATRASITSSVLSTASGIDVGIGTSSPSATLHLLRSSGNTTQYIDNSATNGYSLLQIKNTGSSGKTYEIGVGGSSALAAYAGNLYINDNTASALRLVVESSGDINVKTGNLVVGTAAKGIDFSANTGAAGMTSELLNWYEEGTWTPVLTFNGNSVGITYTTQRGRYTRIGRTVTINFEINLSSKGSSTGECWITGLPYSSAYIEAMTVYLYANFDATYRTGIAYISNDVIYEIASYGTSFFTNAQFTNTSRFWGTCTYQV